MNEFDSKGVKKALMKKIKQDKSIFYKFKFHKVMKYAAVAVTTPTSKFVIRILIIEASPPNIFTAK